MINKLFKTFIVLNFIFNLVKAKDKVAMDDLNTPDELVEVDKIIKE